MKRIDVKGSSNIKTAGFEDGVLEVEFKSGIYQYSPFTFDQFVSFLQSESKTKWININLKNNPSITYKKVG